MIIIISVNSTISYFGQWPGSDRFDTGEGLISFNSTNNVNNRYVYNSVKAEVSGRLLGWRWYVCPNVTTNDEDYHLVFYVWRRDSDVLKDVVNNKKYYSSHEKGEQFVYLKEGRDIQVWSKTDFFNS